MRDIREIIVHCTAGSQKNTASDIVRYHTLPKSMGGCGWSVAGYHYIIEASGKIVNTVDEERVSNGCKRHNQYSINVAYIGGVDTNVTGLPAIDNRTDEQKKSLLFILKMLRKKYPKAKIYGHRDFAKKACPSFDAKKEYANL